MRAGLYSQKITHHWVKIEDGEWFYLVAYFKDGTLSEEARICFSILRGPAVTPIDPFSWSGGGVRLGHSPRNVWLNEDRPNSSVVFPVVVFWFLLFLVNMKVIMRFLGLIVVDLIELSFVWSDMSNGPAFDKSVR